MNDFTLDNSGAVELLCSKPADGMHPSKWTLWSDLSPFAQGYVEEMLEPCEALHYSLTDRFAGFSDLAPETLARIIADCEAFLDRYAKGLRDEWAASESAGRSFWIGRVSGRGDYPSHGFPPLTVTLGDDGKVRFA